MCRVFERIILKEIQSFLVSNKIISLQQFGFVKKSSTEILLSGALNDWYRGLYNKKSIEIIFIDFKKAFDSIPHNLLLFKLYKLGIRGKLLNWIQAFLTNRTFRVKIGNSFSDPKNILSGVPQGSVLGPVLFQIYINDIINDIPEGIKIKLFADNLKIYSRFGTNETNNLQLTLDKVINWSNQWALSISNEKTFILHLGRNNPTQTYKIVDNPIKETEFIRELGVYIDKNLEFNRHFGHLCKIAYYRMRHLFMTIISKSLKTHSFYIPHMFVQFLSMPHAHGTPQIKKIYSESKRYKEFLHV